MFCHAFHSLLKAAVAFNYSCDEEETHMSQQSVRVDLKTFSAFEAYERLKTIEVSLTMSRITSCLRIVY